MSEETKNMTNQKGDEALKGLSMKERKKLLEERKEKRRKKCYIAIGAVVVILIAALLLFDSGLFHRSMTALTVGEKSYSAAEVDYFYYSEYNNYSSYAMYYGLDTSKSLKDQEIYEGTSWYEYFRDSAKKELTNVSILTQEAEKEGYTLSEAGQKEVEEVLEDLRVHCKENGYSVKYYLQNTYGRSMNEEIYQKVVLECQLAKEYQEKTTESFKKTEKDIQKYYKKHAAELDTFAYQAYQVPASAETKTDKDGNPVEPTKKETKAAQKKAKKGAEALEQALKAGGEAEVTKLTEEYGCVDYSNQSYSSFSGEGFSDWLTDPNRKAGDVTTIEDKTEATEETEAVLNGYYVVRFDKRFLDEYRNVTFRNILVSAEAEKTGEGEAEKDDAGNPVYNYDEALKQAKALQKTWKKNGGDGKAMAKLAEEHSGDPASNANGGQYENAAKEDVTGTLKGWLFEEKRKAGDVVLLKDEAAQGYQLVYFEGYSDKMHWQDVSEDALQQADYEKWYEKVEKTYEDSISTSFMYRYV